MLVSSNRIRSCRLIARDGEIGQVAHLLLDKQSWTVRYLVVQVGHFFNRHPVLISPISIQETDWENQTILVSLTRDEVKDSPEIDIQSPITRQSERRLHDYYSWAPYWGGGNLWGSGFTPGDLAVVSFPAGAEPFASEEPEAEDEEPGFLFTDDMLGYGISAHDGELGEVKDFIVDDVTWQISHLVVDVGGLLSTREVVIPQKVVLSVQPQEAQLEVDLIKDNIKGAPEFEPSDPVNEESGKRYDYYGRKEAP